MATEVIMPKAGMSMEVGTVVKWLKKEGDPVEKGEPILEILTDKVNMEVEAEVSGILLKILAEKEEELPVFTVLAYIGAAGEVIPDQSDKLQAKNTPQADVKPEIEVDQKATEDKGYQKPIGKVRATPASRKEAKKNKIDLIDINGNGPKGRIQLQDVLDYVSHLNKESKITPLAKRISEVDGIDTSDITGSGYDGKITKSDLPGIDGQSMPIVKESEPVGEITLIPMKGVRKVIADRMSESYFSVPAVVLNMDVNMTNVKAFREQIRDSILESTGMKVTFTDIITFIVSKALIKYPIMNASLTDRGIELHHYVNMAMAVDVNNTLKVPVVKGVDKMSLSEIVVAFKDLVTRTKENRLSPNEMEGSTFTISNLGGYGISSFSPIINLPNAAILGVNAILDRVVAVEGEMVIQPMMTLSLTFDHRIVDGAPAAEFMAYLKKLMENPITTLI